MQEQLSHKRQALGAGIQMSDARMKRRSEEDSPGLVLQYDLIQGFLQKIGPALAEYPQLHLFYFPIQSEQLLSVYRTAEMPEPLPLELRPYLIITLAKAHQLFNETLDARFLSSYHPPLENFTYQYGQNMVLDVIFSTLGGQLPYKHQKAATSLVIQDERIQDNQNRALGFIAHMVIHRFRNFRQVAEFIVQEYPTAQEVSKDAEHFEEKIRAMKAQLNIAGRLEKQLQYIGSASHKTPITLGELVDILEYVFYEKKKQAKSSIELEVGIPDSSRTDLVVSPPAVIEEVLNNALENMFRIIDHPDVENKKLSLHSHAEEQLLCLDLINYGPVIAPDVSEDLQRLIRVSRPSGSGLGIFLSVMIMRRVGGDLEVISPIPGKDIGVCYTFKFPRP